MRTIKYRGKVLKKDKWVFGFFVHDEEWAHSYIYYPANVGGFIQMCRVEVDPQTVGQFTGLTDKNGKEICDGDVDGLREIKYLSDYGGFVIWDGKRYERLTCDTARFLTINSNIYENR